MDKVAGESGHEDQSRAVFPRAEAFRCESLRSNILLLHHPRLPSCPPMKKNKKKNSQLDKESEEEVSIYVKYSSNVIDSC